MISNEDKIIAFFRECRYMNINDEEEESKSSLIAKIITMFLVNVFIYCHTDLYTSFLSNINPILYYLFCFMVITIFTMKFIYVFKKIDNIDKIIIFVSIGYYITFFITIGITIIKNKGWGFAFYIFFIFFNLNIFII